MKSRQFGITRSLKHRNFRLFFCGQSISLIGTWITRVASSWLVYRLSHSAWVLGLVSFAGLIPTFFIAPFAGVLVDRWNKHHVLIATQVLAALQSATMAALTLSGRITVPQIIVLSLVQGLINAFDMPVRQSFVVQSLRCVGNGVVVPIPVERSVRDHDGVVASVPIVRVIGPVHTSNESRCT